MLLSRNTPARRRIVFICRSSRAVDGVWTRCGYALTKNTPLSLPQTGVRKQNTSSGPLSTNGCAYPHIRQAYPHGEVPERRDFLGRFWPGRSLVAIQQLSQGADVATEVVILGHLALDLFSAV